MKDLEREFGLKVIGFFIVIKVDSDGMVLVSRGDSSAVMGVFVIEVLFIGSIVVFGKFDVEFFSVVVVV